MNDINVLKKCVRDNLFYSVEVDNAANMNKSLPDQLKFLTGKLDANETVLAPYYGFLFDNEHKDTGSARTGIALLTDKGRIVYGYSYKFLWMKRELLQVVELKKGTEVDVHGTNSEIRNVVKINNGERGLTLWIANMDAAQAWADKVQELIKQ